MSTELRNLLHAAAETGPVPDVDAIFAAVRRRHRRRVAVSIGTSVLAVVIAIAALLPGKPLARVTVVNPQPTSCPKPAVRDLNSYRPSYLPYGFLTRPQTLAGDDIVTQQWVNYDTGAKLLLHVSRTLTAGQVGSTDNFSFEIDCGRGFLEQVNAVTPSQSWPGGLPVQAVAWRLDKGTKAELVLERSGAGSSTATLPTVGELVKMARSVAVCPMTTNRCRFP